MILKYLISILSVIFYLRSFLQKDYYQNVILIISLVLIIGLVVILYLLNKSRKKIAIKLKKEIDDHQITKDELDILNEELDKKIVERTADIEKTNDWLSEEIDKYKIKIEEIENARNKAEDADRLKSNFLAGISREVRSSLDTITGFSQMLGQDDLPSNKRREYIRLIKEGCNSLINLIDDTIDFATIESGGTKIEMKDFNPHPVLEFLHDHFTSVLVKKKKDNIRLAYANENIENDIIINTDPARLKQIFSILLDNAIKFTENGNIEFGFVHPNNNEIEFFVRDTGIGIDYKYRDLIFERFKQVGDSALKENNGAGIGLSVAKSLADILNGKIWFESTLGKGTTFYFKFPHQIESDEDEYTFPYDNDWQDKVILVAEDKKINFEIIQETLSITNVELLWAKNGKEALDIVEKNKNINLVLMDIQMPEMDGYETTRRIKEINASLPVIAQTAYALPQDSFKCFDAGCDDYIAKPISLKQFLIKLDKYLSLKKSL